MTCLSSNPPAVAWTTAATAGLLMLGAAISAMMQKKTLTHDDLAMPISPAAAGRHLSAGVVQPQEPPVAAQIFLYLKTPARNDETSITVASST